MPNFTMTASLFSGRMKTEYQSNFRNIKKEKSNVITVYRHMIACLENQR